MEESKAAAYYEELTRKGEGAARFKQGLGFSSSSSSSSYLPFAPSPSSLLSNFVRATNPCKSDNKQSRLESIQSKLRKPHRSSSPNPHSSDTRYRRRRRSRSFSDDDVEDKVRDRSRNSSIRDLRKDRRREKDDALDYPRLIKGYSQMTPAERVKAKMKLQLSQTAAKDSTMGMSSGWERFDFNKDAPLDDDDDEIEVAEDDASLVKEIGNSFRFSAVQARHEERIKAAHDEAMFGASAKAPTIQDSETITDAKKTDDEIQDNNNLLISDKVLAMQQGSWRDRAGRFNSGI